MSVVVWFFLGVFGWTFMEYGMHHWNGHLSKGKLTFSREHLAHHSQFDYKSPWKTQIRMALPILTMVFLGGWLVAGLAGGVAFTAGLGLAYLGYGRLHNMCHDSAPRTAFGRWARRHHFYHHFTDAKYNHGVTSPLWDLVFRTYRAPGLIEVPPKRAMPWLLDEEGLVKPEYQAHYALRARRPRRPRPQVAA